MSIIGIRLAEGLAGAYIAGIVVALVGLYVLKRMIRWKIFTKGGEAGWKSLIPVYGDVIEYKIIWGMKWYFIELACYGVISTLAWIPFLGPILAAAALVVLVVMSVLKYIQEAKAFGQDTGFAIGLIIFNFVFQLLLAYDKRVEYYGPQPSPAIFGKIDKDAEGAE